MKKHSLHLTSSQDSLVCQTQKSHCAVCSWCCWIQTIHLPALGVSACLYASRSFRRTSGVSHHRFTQASTGLSAAWCSVSCSVLEEEIPSLRWQECQHCCRHNLQPPTAQGMAGYDAITWSSLQELHGGKCWPSFQVRPCPFK